MDTELKTRHNLPSQPTSFIGRASEITEITALLDNPNCRLLTLVGPGGIGKTRLTIEVARCVLDAFPDGVFFVPLQPLRSTDDIVTSIVETLPLQLHGSTDPQQQLLDYLREKYILLILDNFEHLLDGVSIVTDILDTAPHVKLLVTSREALNLQVEYLWPVQGLNTPPDDALDVFDEYSAVQLFVERAWRIKPDFSPETHRHEVVRICRLVAGLPLALELAAGWTRALSPQAIGDEVQRSIDFLASNQRDVLERHRSMRAVFDHSWHLLSEEERVVFPRLSVFRGGFTLEAAEQVAGASLSPLVSLIDKSLLRLDASGRYDLHELLRQYAQEQLEVAGETETTLDTHCQYYADLLDARRIDLAERSQKNSFDEIGAEFENIRMAWDRAVGRTNYDGIIRMHPSLYWFWYSQGRWQEGLKLFQWAYDQFSVQPNAESLGARYCRARLVESLGFIYFMSGAYEQAKECLKREFSVILELNDKHLISQVTRHLGSVERLQGNYVEARQYFLTSFEAAEEIGDRDLMVASLTNLGVVAGHQKDYATAYQLYQQSIALSKEAKSQLPGLVALSRLGILETANGNYVTAKQIHEQILMQDIEANNHWGMANDLCHLGIAEVGLGQERTARKHLSEALEIAGEIHATPLTLRIIVGSARLLAKEAQGAEAAALLGLALSHPQCDAEVRDLADPLIADVQAELGEAAYHAAWERGKSLNLKTVVQQLLAEFKPDDQVVAVAMPLHPHTLESNTALPELLTQRELEILRLIVEGYSNREIADRLVLALSTVKWHINQIYSKLSVDSRTRAAARARELKLLV
jgi:predicted ATPase/DNA-binding NarL/FixJ family response regulator